MALREAVTGLYDMGSKAEEVLNFNHIAPSIHTHVAPAKLSATDMMDWTLEKRDSCGISDPQFELAREIAKQCGADQVISLLHEANAEPVLVEVFNKDATRLTTSRVADLAEGAARCLHRLREKAGGAHVQTDEKSVTAAFSIGSATATITCGVSQRIGSRLQECAAQLRNLLPLIRATYSYWAEAARSTQRARTFCAAVDHTSIAIFLLGENRAILHANPLASSLLADGDGVRSSSGCLACPQLADALRIAAALEHLGSAGRGDKDAGPILALPRRGRRPLMLALVPVETTAMPLSNDAKAIAYLFDPEEDLGSIVEPCCQIYNLSPQEAKLTCALVGGATLAETAERLGLQEQTARSYLKTVFQKTDTHRQAELVQLMLKCAIRVASGQRKRVYG